MTSRVAFMTFVRGYLRFMMVPIIMFGMIEWHPEKFLWYHDRLIWHHGIWIHHQINFCTKLWHISCRFYDILTRFYEIMIPWKKLMIFEVSFVTSYWVIWHSMHIRVRKQVWHPIMIAGFQNGSKIWYFLCGLLITIACMFFYFKKERKSKFQTLFMYYKTNDMLMEK